MNAAFRASVNLNFHWGNVGLRYHFNGMENVDEMHNNVADFYMADYRGIDVRLGRWMSVDPVPDPKMSPYNGFDNNPVVYSDPRGLYTKRRAERMARRAEKRGYHATVVDAQDGDHGVSMQKENEGKTGQYLSTQYSGRLRNIERAKNFQEYGSTYSDVQFHPDNSPGTLAVSTDGLSGAVTRQENIAVKKEAWADAYNTLMWQEQWTREGIWDPNLSAEDAAQSAWNFGLMVGAAAPTPAVTFLNGTIQTTVTFGQNSNQIYHTFRHTQSAGLSNSVVQKAIIKDLPKILGQINTGVSTNRMIVVKGQEIIYSVYKHADGLLNVGRITVGK